MIEEYRFRMRAQDSDDPESSIVLELEITFPNDVPRPLLKAIVDGIGRMFVDGEDAEQCQRTVEEMSRISAGYIHGIDGGVRRSGRKRIPGLGGA